MNKNQKLAFRWRELTATKLALQSRIVNADVGLKALRREFSKMTHDEMTEAFNHERTPELNTL